MKAVSEELLSLITDLNSLESLTPFAIAGGTNLALRYNHRESVDIDLFSSMIVGNDGMNQIANECREKFAEQVLYLDIEDPGFGEQYCFIKALIKRGKIAIKVEVLQNIQLLFPIEKYAGLRLISVHDIGLLKLDSLVARNAKKDVYDLDTITDIISLTDLMNLLKEKKATFKEEKYRSLFDLDDIKSAVEDPKLLLEYDNVAYQEHAKRPSHSNDILKINPDGKQWPISRIHWRRKVVSYCKENGHPIPSFGPIN